MPLAAKRLVYHPIMNLASALLDPPATQTVVLTINGTDRRAEVAPWTTLLDLLRERFDLTGTKKGCDHGQCGACTVLLDGKRVNSCLVLAVAKDGSEVTTIEGLADPGSALHPMQQAFVDCDAFHAATARRARSARPWA